jgi:thiol-disulfide isomerase/thioredoxin|tara:strand:- start:126 stop:650 length:525 start_codon:yes stop_codon:yes gene_type:complete
MACVSLSRPLASTEPRKCDKAQRSLKGFKTTNTSNLFTKESFVNAQGLKKNLADYLGQGIVFNIWATWCAPCVREMPHLDRLKKKLIEDNIEVIAISVDRAGTPIVEKFFHKNKISNLEILANPSGSILRKTKTKGLPTTFLINAKGVEIGRIQGVLDWDSASVVSFLRSCLSP